jgi:hypothetical protein
MKASIRSVIVYLTAAVFLFMPSLGFGQAQAPVHKKEVQKQDLQINSGKNPIQKGDMKMKASTNALKVMPDLTISEISVRKSSGYIYITPTIQSLTSAGCENVDLKFSINNMVHQPYMGVMFDGNSEFRLTGLGFRDEGDDSCTISIQITRGCRELNLSNNTKTVEGLNDIGASDHVIEF